MEKILTPATLKDAGLKTPEACVQTFLWTKCLAADVNSNAFATEKLREISWFPPGFDSLKFGYAEHFPIPFRGTKLLKIESVTYSALDKATIGVGNYDDLSRTSTTFYDLVRDGTSWKVVAPVGAR